VETTLALIIGGLFFIAAGTWSYWAAQEIEAI
jgi:CHASE3 domain sensor protein